MQAITQATQRAALACQRDRFVLAQMAHAHQRFEVAHAEGAQRHPAQRVQVAQAAGAVLDVGLQVVGGVAEAGMADAQFLALGDEEVARRPYARSADGVDQQGFVHRLADDQALFDQRGQHRLVGRSRGRALGRRAHAVADRQPGIPQHGEETRHRLVVALLGVGRGQHQHVHVGLGK